MAFAVFLALSVGAGEGLSQPAPTGVEKSIALTNPSVVLIETRANVNVRVNDPFYGKVASVHINRGDGIGSGFIVNPTGTIVTASHVVDPDQVKSRAAATTAAYAPDVAVANRIINPVVRASELRAIDRAKARCLEAITCQFTIRPIIRVPPDSRSDESAG